MARIFSLRHKKGSREFDFTRDDIVSIAQKIGVVLPKNLGDIIYSFRYRTDMPENVIAAQPEGCEWIINGTGKGTYRFKLARTNRITPREELVTIKIPERHPR